MPDREAIVEILTRGEYVVKGYSSDRKRELAHLGEGDIVPKSEAQICRVGYIDEDGTVHTDYGSTHNARRLRAVLDLRDYCWKHGIDEIVEELRGRDRNVLARQLKNRSETSGIAIRLLESRESVIDAA